MISPNQNTVPPQESNLSDTAKFVKTVLDPFYPKLQEKHIIDIANELVKRGKEVKQEDIFDWAVSCRELAREHLEAIKNDNVSDLAQLDKITNVLENFVDKLIRNVAPPDLAA